MKKLFITIFLLMSFICTEAQISCIYLRPSAKRSNLSENFGNALNKYLSKGYIVKDMRASNNTTGHYLVTILTNENQNNDVESYVFVELYQYKFYLSGDIPSGMKEEYNQEQVKANDVFTELSNHGFQIVCFDVNDYSEYFLFSKKKSGSTRNDRPVSSGEDVKEMARYNLKGNPIDSNYKGIQIIVYSDYSTKVVKNK